MKSYLKKIVAIGLTLFVLGSNFIYAADEKQVITREEAVKAAFTYSNHLSLNAKEKELLRERLKANQNNAYEIYQSIYLEKAKNENQAEVLKDQITYDITNRYNTIVSLKEELLHLDHTILLKTRELEQVRAKKEVGFVSAIQYDTIKLELEELKNSKASQIEFLSNEESYFKLITGKDLAQYTLEDKLAFEIFRVPGNVERYIDTTITTYLKYDKDLAQFAKDHVLIAGGQPIFYADYLDKQYAADKNLSALEDARKAMKDMLMNNYSSLIGLEEQIGILETKLKLLQKQADIAKVQYEVGRMTALAYQKQLLGIEAVEMNLRKLITQYNQLKQVIEKPWVAIISKA
ncbi:hypothetical protein [Cellulosilyticum sp. I15G10I2]|uniref:hypothetical protein n=1 Tax=Cellulosilyticum sp. I15G10I2 TaxID=1892843 RepID=UPI00085BCE6B|nr:hypothetical protein [Cellulosilyticum sp. I15G10I2]